jgi:DNA polymerase-1
VPVIKGSHVYLVDGSGYIFRAFHALPPLTRPSDGLPVGAVHGFCGMLWKLLQDAHRSGGPTHVAVIFDAGRESFRNALYRDYKAHRPPPPDELVPQFPLIRDAVQAFNVACIEQDGFEADDLIATYTREALKRGGNVTIVSSDKDLMQLIKPGVRMLDTMKTPPRSIGADEVREKFGVPPDRVVDVQALAGDSSDNVPGVPGIGVKTAAELIAEYGDLDTLLARAGEIKQPKRRERLTEFAMQARLSRDLVTLKDDVPCTVFIEQLGVQDPKAETLIAFLRRMEFAALSKRIGQALGAAPPAGEPRAEQPDAGAMAARAKPAGGSGAAVPPPGSPPGAAAALVARAVREQKLDKAGYETILEQQRLEAWISDATSAGHVALEVEATGLDAMRAEFIGISLATAPGKAGYVPLQHSAAEGLALDRGGERILAVAHALAALKPLLEDPAILKIGHNLKFACVLLRRHGIVLAPYDDTMLLSYALDGGRGAHELEALSERHLGHACTSLADALEHAPGSRKSEKSFAQIPLSLATQYAAEDADVALRLWLILRARLTAERMATVYETLERPMVGVLAEMERAGIKVDVSILSRLTSTFSQRLARLESEIYELAGHKFNLGSPRQLGELLFDELRLPGGRRTKTGQWETRANLLDELAAREDLPEHARKLINVMLEWRQLSKLISTYTQSLPQHVNPATNRIHTCFALASTTTGRLASADPNLQNIPIRTKEGREIRTAFIAERGHKLISADYSQIELRVLAHVADIPQLKRAFSENLDIHAMTASEMFGVPVQGMPAEVRRRAKAINFGIIYGISAFGLAAQLGISKGEAGDYIATYFTRFPGIRDYMESTKRRAHERGYVETIFGRRVHYPEINTRNPSMRGFLERAAINAPIQGSAADIIRRAMIRMPRALLDANLAGVRMLLQVHDELVFEADDRHVDKAMTIIAGVMERAAEPAVRLKVPVHVDVKAAENWEAAH